MGNLIGINATLAATESLEGEENIEDLPPDVINCVLEFLAMEDVANIQCVSKRFAYDLNLDYVYKVFCGSFTVGNDSGSISESFYKTRALSIAARILQKEIIHLEKCAPIYQRIRSHISNCRRQKKEHGVIGLLCDLVKFKSESVAKAVTGHRGYRMFAIVVKDFTVIQTIKTRTPATNEMYRGERPNLSFIPYDAAKSSALENSNEEGRHLLLEVDAPGFIGYVINLADLKPEHEMLRDTVLWAFFHSLMIFETTSQANMYKETLGDDEGNKVRFIALDYVVPVDQMKRDRDILPVFASEDGDCNNNKNNHHNNNGFRTDYLNITKFSEPLNLKLDKMRNKYLMYQKSIELLS